MDEVLDKSHILKLLIIEAFYYDLIYLRKLPLMSLTRFDLLYFSKSNSTKEEWEMECMMYPSIGPSPSLHKGFGVFSSCIGSFGRC